MTARGPSGLGRLRKTLTSSTLAREGRSRLVITLVASIIVLVAATAVGRGIVSSPAPAPAPAPAPRAPAGVSPRAPADPPDYVRFRDDRGGFSIAYPESWSRVPSRDPEVKLLVAAGRATSLLVRAAPVGLDVTAETLPIVRDLTDRLVRADGRVRLRGEPRPLVLDGLPGYRYDYTFATPSGERGAHVHYFLFKDGQMITLVFQAQPAARLDRDSPLFERVTATFRRGV